MTHLMLICDINVEPTILVEECIVLFEGEIFSFVLCVVRLSCIFAYFCVGTPCGEP